MTAYIGVVGPETIPAPAMISIMNISREEGDGIPEFRFATKGFEARQQHIDNFIDNTKHDHILMLDHDMIFAPDTLTKLRSHNEPFVSGNYMRRRWSPVASVWHEPYDGHWPLMPFLRPTEPGQLYELGGSGWGCILLHRDMILDVRKKILNGEPEVIEDDMDVWPYDLKAILKLIGDLQQVKSVKAAVNIGKLLSEHIRPLSGTRSNIGSDVRYPILAKAAGYQLLGDPEVKPAHILNYPLQVSDWQETIELEAIRIEVQGLRDKWTKETKAVFDAYCSA